MKINITYQDDEAQQARTVLTLICHLLGKVKVRQSDTHKPYMHIYITKERPATGKFYPKS